MSTALFHFLLTLFLVFHFSNDSLESLRVVESEVSEHLTVNLDTGFGQSTHQLRIAHAFHTSGSIDTLNPQGAEVALLIAAVAIGVGQTLLISVLCYCPNILAGSKVTASELQNSLTFCS